MDETTERTFDLPVEQADLIDRLVTSGGFSSASEVVSAGLQALEDRNEEIDRWLRKEVVPVVEAMRANPERGIPSKVVFDEIRALAMSRSSRGPDDA